MTVNEMKNKVKKECYGRVRQVLEIKLKSRNLLRKLLRTGPYQS